MKTAVNFNKIDFEAIKRKVEETERGISGEIVPVIVNKCSGYSPAIYKGILLGSFGVFLFLILIDRFIPGIAIYDPVWYFIYVALGGVFSALAIYFSPPLKRLIAGRDMMDNTATESAEIYFCKEEVFNTRQRTGIMIFIALFEKRIIVKSDQGISDVVSQNTWDELIEILLTSIKHNDISAGIISAIERCGEILKENGFHSDPDDKNELSNELRIEE